MNLSDRILKRKAKVAIVGMGYVGLPLGIEIARSGFPVKGIDLDQRKIAALKAGQSYIEDVPSSDLKPLVNKGLLTASTSYAVVKDCDVINVCVPTPFRSEERRVGKEC
jgi:UDP-N-acetyl-D-glucosamine dehydrogenase